MRASSPLEWLKALTQGVSRRCLPALQVLARIPHHNGCWLDGEPYLAQMRAQCQPQPSLPALNSNPTQQEPHPSTGLPVPPSVVKPANNEAVGSLIQGHPLCPSVSQARVSPECTSVHLRPQAMPA